MDELLGWDLRPTLFTLQHSSADILLSDARSHDAVLLRAIHSCACRH